MGMDLGEIVNNGKFVKQMVWVPHNINENEIGDLF